MLEELQTQYKDKFGFYYVDVEEDANLSQRFALRGVPSIIFFNDGVLQGKLAGNIEDETVENKIAEVLAHN